VTGAHSARRRGNGAGSIWGGRVGAVVAPIVGVVGFFGLWELLVRALDVKAFVMPAPSRIVRTIANSPAFYWREGTITGREALGGLAIALVLALALAIPMARSSLVERAVQPVTTLVQVIPLVCYAPAFVIWLRPGAKPILAVTALISFVPLLYNLVAGLRATDRDARDVLLSVGAGRFEVLRTLEIPSALPNLFAGLRTAVGLSLIGAVLGEWFALRSHGIGLEIQKGAVVGAPRVWAAAFTLAAMGTVALAALGVLERAVAGGQRARPHGQRTRPHGDRR
jgi:NitT/TauT family transport system permease protein